MRIEMKRPGALSAQELAAWRALQAGGGALSSPYFAPEFAQAAEAAFSGARAALIYDGADLAGVWAFRRGPLGFCRPVGGALSDFHGLLTAPDRTLDIGAIARACGARVYGFDHLPEDQTRHGFAGEADGGCAVIGLEDGYDAWRQGRMAATSAFKTLDRKGRGLARDHSDIRYVLDDRSDAAFEALCAWKREQMQAAGHFDIFAAAPTRTLLARIRAASDPRFRGVLSTLYVDGRLVAAHFGMQAGETLHYWFPGYDPAFGKYSVGSLLLDELARGGDEMGWRAIHLGKGDYRYKREFGSHRIPLLTGVLRTPSFAGAAHRAADWARRRAEAAPLGPVSDAPGKAMRKALRITDFGWAAA